MNMRTWMFLIIFIPFLTSCQVKESTGSGGLFSGHLPATNAFTIQTPATRTYKTGDTLSLVLNFPYDVTVTGSPRLAIDVGGTTVYATYASFNI